MKENKIIYSLNKVQGDLRELIQNVKAARSVSNKFEHILYTSLDLTRSYVRIFNKVEYREDLTTKKRQFKIETLIRCNHKKALYLDCDVEMLTPPEGIFEAIDGFDIGLCHDCSPLCFPERRSANINKVPGSFVEFNSGVILFRKTEATINLFSKWRESYMSFDAEPFDRLKQLGINQQDQPHLRKCCYEDSAKIKMFVMPEEYNWRIKGSAGQKKVIFLHRRRSER